MRGAVALLAAGLALAGLAGCGGNGAEPGAPQGATLVLDFVPNAVHSGIYAAASQGYYEDEGVDLKVQPPGESTDAPKLLGAGKVEFAILDIHDLGIAREHGLEVVGAMPIVQAPLASVIARGDGPVRRPRDISRARPLGDLRVSCPRARSSAAEQETLNLSVVGSSPTGLTNASAPGPPRPP